MSIVDTLAQDHRALEKMLGRLGDIASSEAAERTSQFTQLQALLQSHSRTEEEVVYRRLRRNLPDEVKILEALEEHHVADVLLQELASACPGGRGWAVKMKVLEELLCLHIKEEELNLFPLIAEGYDEATHRLMDEEFRALKHERLEALLAPLRRMMPAFAGRAAITVQAAAGRYARRGELALRRTLNWYGSGTDRRGAPARPRAAASRSGSPDRPHSPRRTLSNGEAARLN